MAMSPARSSEKSFRQQAVEFAALLGGEKSVLVGSHKSPDGDALCSLLAAARILTILSSRPVCVVDGQIPERFNFLPGADQIRSLAQLTSWNFDAVLTVDCGSLSRLGALADRIGSEPLLVNIDHHPDNSLFGRLNIIFPEASSTAELLYDIILALNVPLDVDLATILYTGLMTDTGGFRYSNTSSTAFAMAARLVQAGADPAILAQAIYSNNSLHGIKLLGEAAHSLDLSAGGRVASMTVQQPEASEELEEITDFALTIKGVRALALFRLAGNTVRCSLRARGSHDVARIARKYGGGGHQKAAGFTWDGSLEEIRIRVLADLREEVEEQLENIPAAEKILPTPPFKRGE